MRVGALVSACGLAVAALATLAACKVSVPDPTTGVFRCGSDHDCLSGYGCFHPEGQQNGELGYCTPGGQAIEPCGQTLCREGEVCVRADGQGALECRASCTDDLACNPTGLCAVVARADGVLVGACATCPECETGRGCAKHRDSYDLAGALYCNAPGQDCSSSGDTDGDGMAGCQDADCLGSSVCPACGNLAIDTGEACDGYSIAGGQSCPAGTSGALHCDANCQIDARDCAVPQQSCGNGALEGTEQCEYKDSNLLVVDGKTDCSAWIGGTSGPVTCNASCQVDTSACGGATAVCGNSSVDGGESCDGSAGIVACGQLDPEYTSTSSPTCSPYCYYDMSSCQPAGAVCGTCNTVGECVTSCQGTLECEPWITSPGLQFATPASTSFRTAITYQYGLVWVAWESANGIESASYSPNGNLSPAGLVSLAGTTPWGPAIALDGAQQPVVAYVSDNGTGPRLYLSQLVGGVWSGLGDSMSNQGEGISGAGVGLLGPPVLAPVPDGMWLAAAMQDGTVRMWFVNSTSYAEHSAPSASGVSEIALTADPLNNQPILAWVQSGALYVSRFNGTWDAPTALAGTAGDAPAASPSISYNDGELVAAWNSTGSSQVFVERLSSTGSWTPLQGSSSANVVVGPSLGRVAVVRLGWNVVVAWAEDGPDFYRQNRVLDNEGEVRGWRGFAGTECAGSSVDPTIPAGNADPALAAGYDGINRMACMSYIAKTGAGPELRVSCHRIP